VCILSKSLLEAYTEWRGLIECLIFTSYVPQKSPIINSSFAESHLERKASYASLPLYRALSSGEGVWESGGIGGNLGESGEIWGNLVESGGIWGNLGEFEGIESEIV